MICCVSDLDILCCQRELNNTQCRLVSLNNGGGSGWFPEHLDIQDLTSCCGDDSSDRSHAFIGIFISADIRSGPGSADHRVIQSERLLKVGASSIGSLLNAGIGEHQIKSGLIESNIAAVRSESKCSPHCPRRVIGIIGDINR